MNERTKNPDEIVMENVKFFHLENMTPQHLWCSIQTKDDKLYHLNIFAKGDKLVYYWSDESV